MPSGLEVTEVKVTMSCGNLESLTQVFPTLPNKTTVQLLLETIWQYIAESTF